MLSLDQALLLLVQGSRAFRIQAQEAVSTFDGLGRVLVADVRSALDVPPQDNSSMDGYALRAADVPAAGTELQVSQRIPAGVVGQPLQPGTAARIFTGAQLPAGADAVVMQEQCEVLPGAGAGRDERAGAGSVAGAGAGAASGQPGLGSVRVQTVPGAGQWVRRRGEDVQAGSVVLTAGLRLTPQALGLAASVGAATLQVLRRPRVAIFSTGDELLMPGQPLRPGAIYNSNRFTLRALALAAGCQVTDLGIVPDQLDATRQALREAAQGHDLIVTSGGVSVGEEDHLRPAVLAEGTLQNWQLAIKPGKPLAFGTVRRRAVGSSEISAEIPADPPADAALFIGLPGNPVSSFVTWLLAVGPVLRTLQGLDPALPQPVQLRADFDWPRADKRREFLRVRVNAEGGLDLFANQSSGVLTSTVWADGLVDNPPAQVIRRGDRVAYLPLAAWVGL